MFKPNGDQTYKKCPKCKREHLHICGYDRDVWGNPVALDKCDNCGNVSEWDEEAKDEDAYQAS